MGLVEVQNTENTIESLADEYFSLTESVTIARRCLVEYEKNNILIKGDFEEDLWVFEHHQNKGLYVYLHFNVFDSINGIFPEYIKNIVKCWAGDLLTRFYPSSVQTFLKNLHDAAVHSEGFHINKEYGILRWIKQKSVSDNTKAQFINSILNFLDYGDFEINDIYVPKLLDYRRSLTLERNVRPLPPSNQILKFSYYLDSFFESLELIDLDGGPWDRQELKILYYPIVIWWRLTNIIPLRPTEFCTITRYCLISEGGEYYIQLPRIKDEYNSRRIQIVDRIKISTEMYELIDNYISLTEKFGRTETLISYRAIAALTPPGGKEFKKNDMNYFSKGILRALIEKFYKEILFEKYNLSFDKEHYVRPSSTRHLAFTSLMMQGISPVEIARLGGHRTIAAQYHYQFHLEYWIDSEVFKLMKYRNKITQDGLLGIKDSNIENNFIPREVLLKAYLPTSSNVRKKLKVGYCIDEFQRCPTEECLACDNWRIDPNELIEKKEIIKEKIEKSRKKIHELAAFIANIHKIILADDLARIDSSTFIDLKTNVNSVNDQIHVLTKLLAIPLIEE